MSNRDRPDDKRSIIRPCDVWTKNSIGAWKRALIIASCKCTLAFWIPFAKHTRPANVLSAKTFCLTFALQLQCNAFVSWTIISREVGWLVRMFNASNDDNFTRNWKFETENMKEYFPLAGESDFVFEDFYIKMRHKFENVVKRMVFKIGFSNLFYLENNFFNVLQTRIIKFSRITHSNPKLSHHRSH